MKALATLKNVDSETCVKMIVRNLSRILDIRIIDIDRENGILCFLYSGQKTFDQVKKELIRIGHPIQNYTTNFSQNMDSDIKGARSVSLLRSKKDVVKISP